MYNPPHSEPREPITQPDHKQALPERKVYPQGMTPPYSESTRVQHYYPEAPAYNTHRGHNKAEYRPQGEDQRHPEVYRPGETLQYSENTRGQHYYPEALRYVDPNLWGRERWEEYMREQQ